MIKAFSAGLRCLDAPPLYCLQQFDFAGCHVTGRPNFNKTKVFPILIPMRVNGGIQFWTIEDQQELRK